MKLVNKTLLFALCALFAGCDMGNSDASFDDSSTIISSVTPEAITAAQLNGTKWTYSDDYNTYTLEFTSDKDVTYSIDGSDKDYTYTVSDATITIYDNSGTVVFPLTYYSSGQLIFIQVAIIPDNSSALSDTISASQLASTTWTAKEDNYTYMLEFTSDNTVTITSYTGVSKSEDPISGTYSIDGTTVTVSISGNKVQYFYISGQLIFGLLFTKSTISA